MMNGSGGIVGAAKNAASDVVHAGEEVLHGIYYKVFLTIFLSLHCLYFFVFYFQQISVLKKYL